MNTESTKNYQLLTANKLKIIAVITMFFDHFVTVFMPNNEPLNLIFRLLGRTAAPVFCYFIAVGFNYTSNVKKYILRLLIFAAISHIPYNICFGYKITPTISLKFFEATSVIWPLALGLIALALIKNVKINFMIKPVLNNALNLALKAVILAVCCAAAYASNANWYFIAVLWVVAFGLFYGNFKLQITAFCFIGIIHLLWQLKRYGFFDETQPQWFQLGIFLAVPLLLLFNGKPGKKSKFMTWFFYVFYPTHLILLFLLNKFTPLAEIIYGLL